MSSGNTHSTKPSSSSDDEVTSMSSSRQHAAEAPEEDEVVPAANGGIHSILDNADEDDMIPGGPTLGTTLMERTAMEQTAMERPTFLGGATDTISAPSPHHQTLFAPESVDAKTGFDWAVVNRLRKLTSGPLVPLQLPLSFATKPAHATRLRFPGPHMRIVSDVLVEWFQESHWTVEADGEQNPGFRASRMDAHSATMSVQFYQDRENLRGGVCDIMRLAGDCLRVHEALGLITGSIKNHPELGSAVQFVETDGDLSSKFGDLSLSSRGGALAPPPLVRGALRCTAPEQVGRQDALELAAQRCAAELGLASADSEADKLAANQYLTQVAESIRDGGVSDIGDQMVSLCESPVSARDVLEQTGPVTLLDQMADCLTDERSPWFLHAVCAFAALAEHKEHHQALLSLNVHRFFALYVRNNYQLAPFGRSQLYCDSLRGLQRLAQSEAGIKALRTAENRPRGLAKLTLAPGCFRGEEFAQLQALITASQ